MAQDHYIRPVADTAPGTTVRLGAGSGTVNNLTTAEVGKFATLAGESRYALAVLGADIDGVITAVELAPQKGFTIGTVGYKRDLIDVTFDGLQGTPGTGAIAIGDIVNVGTPVAKDTALTAPPRVCKAATPANVVMKWRVVSLGTVGTGAPGTTGVIERI